MANSVLYLDKDGVIEMENRYWVENCLVIKNDSTKAVVITQIGALEELPAEESSIYKYRFGNAGDNFVILDFLYPKYFGLCLPPEVLHEMLDADILGLYASEHYENFNLGFMAIDMQEEKFRKRLVRNATPILKRVF